MLERWFRVWGLLAICGLVACRGAATPTLAPPPASTSTAVPTSTPVAVVSTATLVVKATEEEEPKSAPTATAEPAAEEETEPPGPVATCYDCWGLWIDTNRVEGLQAAANALSEGRSGESGMLCPSCPDGHLARQVIRDTELDWCPTCRGLFLDKGEREHLMATIPPPGSSGLVSEVSTDFDLSDLLEVLDLLFTKWR